MVTGMRFFTKNFAQVRFARSRPAFAATSVPFNKIPIGTKAIDPVGYLDFLQLEGGGKLILTDSGGLQEEACILGVPCVTLRDNTERPETVDVGANIIAGVNGNIAQLAKKIMASETSWNNPYGAGNAAELMINKILD